MLFVILTTMHSVFFLCSVAWSLLGITLGFYQCNVVPVYYDNIEHNFIMWNVGWSLMDNIPRDVYLQLCKVVPRELRQQGKGFFLVQCCLEPQGQHCIGFFLCNVVQGVLRQHCMGLFPVQCCMEPLGQHCTKFLSVPCCTRSIKTTLNMMG